MAFISQLKLLLWKNVILRCRQPAITTIELIWPLFLFIILALVRTRELQELKHECHFDSRALPSAGLFPFFQSVGCNINQTCHVNETDSEKFQYTDSFSNTTFRQLFKDLSVLFRTQDDLNLLRKLYDDLKTLAKFAKIQIPTGTTPCVSNVRNVIDINKLIQRLNQSGIQVSDKDRDMLFNLRINQTHLLNITTALSGVYVTYRSMFSQVVKTKLCFGNDFNLLFILPTNYSDDLRQQICRLDDFVLRKLIYDIIKDVNYQNITTEINKCLAKSNLPPINPELNDIRVLNETFEDIIKLSSFWNTMEDLINLLNSSENMTASQFSQQLCGRNHRFLSNILQGIENTNTSLFGVEEEEIADEDSHRKVIENKRKCLNKSESMTNFCKNIICDLQKKRSTRLLWNQLKALIRGKILYTPNTPLVREFLNKTLTIFNEAGIIKRFARQFVLASPMLKRYIDGGILKIYLEAFDLYLPAINDIEKSMNDYRFSNSYKKFSKIAKETDFKKILKILTKYLNISANILDCIQLDKLVPIDNEPSMLYEAQKMIENDTFWAGIILNFPDNSNAQLLPKFLHYKIRMDAWIIDNTRHKTNRFWSPGPRANAFTDFKYFLSGFIYLQDMLEKEFIRSHSLTKNDSEIGIYMQQFPYPCYIFDKFVRAITGMMPMFMTLAWIFSIAMIIRAIVYEKEKRLKEIMKTMGLANLVHWLGHFIVSFLILFCSSLMLLVILKVGRVLQHTNAGVLFVFMLCHILAAISQAFLISTFFSRANLAAACGGIIYFVFYLPYTLCLRYEEDMQGWQKFIACFSSTVSFGFGCSYIARYEQTGAGLQWSNIGKSPLPDDTFSAGQAMLMMLFDAILYLALTWYIEAVKPGEYGVPEKFYFPFQKSYWVGYSTDSKDKQPYTTYEMDRQDPNYFEYQPPDVKVGVSIQGLKKKFDNGKIAVDDLSVNFNHGEITSFLGHNGAGKTTTISILTGIIPPNSGTAFVYGKNIATDLYNVRQSMGLCPQYNVLFDRLTVAEHVWFYASIKGMQTKEINEEMDKLLSDVELLHKKHDESKTLSGGMKRKLSIAIAFVANSKLVILDEPTAGVDPHARRSIWQLLLKYKRDRTIILCTHFMDEADILGDKIAILAHGKLMCYGSSIFLKTNLGDGYELTLVRKNGSDESKNAENKRDLSRLIEEHVDNCKIVEDVGTEITYELPINETNKFVDLFNDLDDNLSNLGISSYGISDATLEEVFLKVAHSAKVTESTQECKVPVTEDENDMSFSGFSKCRTTRVSIRKQYPFLFRRVCDSDSKTLVSNGNNTIKNQEEMEKCNGAGKRKIVGVPLLVRQFRASFIKRFHNSRRNIKGLIAEIILPAIFVCLAMIFAAINIPRPNDPPMELNPYVLKPSNADDKRLYSFYSNDEPSNDLSNKLAYEIGNSKTGPGNRCLLKSVYEIDGKPCESHESTKWSKAPNVIANFSDLPTCSCKSGFQVCQKGAEGPPAARRILPTTDVLFNLTGYNVSDWLKKTMPDYIKKRYGGYSFLVTNELGLNELEKRNVSENVEDFLKFLCENTTMENNCELTKLFDIVKPLIGRINTLESSKIWFNNKGHPASVSYLNSFHNSLLRAKVDHSIKNEYGIVAVQHPVNLTYLQLEDFALKASAVDVLIAISVIFAMSFIPASFVLFLIDERVSNSKHLQFVSGVHPLVYWISTFVWDMMNYCFTAIICFFIFLAFQKEAYVSSQNAPCLLLLLFLYGWSIIPMMYPANYVFNIPSSAFVGLSSLNLFLGFISTISTFVIELFDDDDLVIINKILKKVFLVLPQYCLGRGLIDMTSNQLRSDLFNAFGESSFKNPLDWDLCGKNILSMFFLGIFFFGLTICLQYKFWYYLWSDFVFTKFFKSIGNSNTSIWINDEEDVDVVAEKERVANCDDLLKVEGFQKIYKNVRLCPCKVVLNTAVNNLNFGVSKGQCFGLLGVNGAGKTTTFKMLTGDEAITGGNAFIDGCSVKTDANSAYQKIGYCPQFDAIWPLLTAEEHLTFYSRIRGVPEEDINVVVKWAINRMNLVNYAKKVSGIYSGGNKRKLSTAIALIGNPSIVFLDEPTTGMDPAAKRFLWTSIIKIVKEGRSVVLTSHSMEECEALCGKIAIMVNGTFKCFGSVQHIKNRFGKGYTLTIRVGSQENLKPVKKYVEKTFKEHHLLDEQNLMLQYRISKCKLAVMFEAIESEKEKLNIENYSLAQTTLDQVFIDFAKNQHDFENDYDAVQVNSSVIRTSHDDNITNDQDIIKENGIDKEVIHEEKDRRISSMELKNDDAHVINNHSLREASFTTSIA